MTGAPAAPMQAPARRFHIKERFFAMQNVIILASVMAANGSPD